MFKGTIADGEQELVSTQVELKQAKELVETKQEDIGFIITDIKSLKDAIARLEGVSIVREAR